MSALTTKARTLMLLREAGFPVPPLMYFRVEEWRRDAGAILDRILSGFAGSPAVAIRSSSRLEDRQGASLAGAFRSVLDVALEPAAVRGGIEQVVASFGDGGTDDDEILVQQMVPRIVMSGVIMTRVLEDGSPYYCINYDDESGKSDTVTGGFTVSKTVYVFRAFRNSDFDSPRLRNLLRLVRQIESHFGSNALDIEFAMSDDQEHHLLQVRPIAARTPWPERIEEEVTDKISFVEDFLQSFSARRSGLYGSRTILGIMPDWNPAEIIGLTPRPLASSLYRYIITKSIWRRARESMDYRSMPPEELMVLIAGRPYIDVRSSFNSFLPSGVAPETAEVLVNAWLDRLDARPQLHDKVEFEIVPTAMDFTFDTSFAERYPGLLDPKALRDYRECLGRVTAAALSLEASASLPTALATVEGLARMPTEIDEHHVRSPNALIGLIKHLLEACRWRGTLPFSVIARHAFIAEALLRSAVARDALGRDRYLRLKESIVTISTHFSQDHGRVLRGELGAAEFMTRYGHLRPGTYDILTPTYRDSRDMILGGVPRELDAGPPEPFELSARESGALERLLAEAGLAGIAPADLVRHARLAIAGRENAKFEFSRVLSDAIELVARWGQLHDFSREDLSWLSILDIVNTQVEPILGDAKVYFASIIARNRAVCAAGKNIKIGYLIRSPRDVYVVPQHKSLPNFVTRKRITAPVVAPAAAPADADLAGAIVCIENADPGYDWIFSRSIAGLVTKYGGANSHMTIRCSEYGIPAAIGCGENLFARVLSAKYCELDAEAKVLRPV